MITVEQFENWLYYNPPTVSNPEEGIVVTDSSLRLCQGPNPSFWAELKPEFRPVLQYVFQKINEGFIRFDGNDPCVIRKLITPKKRQ